ncbi:MAG: N-acetylmuramoyl-L-alanine amidase [Myxococcota bacterium]
MLLLLACAPAPSGPTQLHDAFTSASEEYDVPYDVLVATAWEVSRLDQRFGEVNREGGVGVMNLREGAAFPSLAVAAELSGQDADALVDDPAANIRGAAALLRFEADQYRKLTGERVDTLEEWYPLVAAWSGASDPLVGDGFAAQVYDWIQWGLAAEAPNGEVLEVEPQKLPWRENTMAMAGSGLVHQFIPACADNYSNYSRGAGDVSYVIIHTMEGSYSGSISWFQNCSAEVSAHYLLRSSDGQITQMLDEADVGWHAGNWDYNLKSIGIEHEGYVSQPDTWYTDTMYRASAALTADICDRYGIPKDRAHVIGHNEVPGATHTDPGSGWDWDYYMSLVTGTGSGSTERGGTGTSDGPLAGSFSGKVTAVRYGETDTCDGAVSGAINGGQLYLSGTCRLRNHPEKSGDLPVVWTGTVSGTELVGTMVVDGHRASFTGQLNGDGSVTAEIAGDEDLGGDVGTLEYEASFSAAPS